MGEGSCKCSLSNSSIPSTLDSPTPSFPYIHPLEGKVCACRGGGPGPEADSFSQGTWEQKKKWTWVQCQLEQSLSRAVPSPRRFPGAGPALNGRGLALLRLACIRVSNEPYQCPARHEMLRPFPSKLFTVINQGILEQEIFMERLFPTDIPAWNTSSRLKIFYKFSSLQLYKLPFKLETVDNLYMFLN